MPGHNPSPTSGRSRSRSPGATRTEYKRNMRSRMGCATCRARKVKCDEDKPTCGPCVKRRVKCSWKDQDIDISPARCRTACTRCRSSKSRCSGPGLNNICERCRLHDTICVWVERDTTLTVDSLAAGAGSLGSEAERLLGDESALRSLVAQYFATVHHYGYYGFIHQRYFTELLERKRAPKELMLLMCANAVRFSTEASTVEALAEADLWSDTAIEVLLPRIHRGFGAVHLMAMVLAHLYQSARGSHTSAWLLLGNATRMMQLLSLHTFDESYSPTSDRRLSPLLRPEALRRLAWSIFVSDSFADGGRYGAHGLTFDTARIQLPCDEATFLRDQQADSASALDFGKSSSLDAHFIKTAEMRRRILHFASQVKHTHKSAADLASEIAQIDLELRILVTELPTEYTYSEEQYYILGNKLPMFVHIHTLRHNCFIILCRAKMLVLCRQLTTVDPISLCNDLRRERIARALPTAHIIKDALRHNINIDPLVGIQAYVAMEILLLEPKRLALYDTTVDPQSGEISSALEALLALVRRLSCVTDTMKLLHVEACLRVKSSPHDLLLSDIDLAAFRQHFPLSGQEEDEYNFRDFRLEKGERYRRTPRTTLQSQHDVLLDLTEGLTAPPSAYPSPTRAIDAAAVAFGPPGVDTLAPDVELAGAIPHVPALNESLRDWSDLDFNFDTTELMSFPHVATADMYGLPDTDDSDLFNWWTTQTQNQ